MKQFWIWPIALYLFLGGLGGGMMATAAVVGLLIAPSALTSGALVWGVFIAFLILGIGTGLLVFELGPAVDFLPCLRDEDLGHQVGCRVPLHFDDRRRALYLLGALLVHVPALHSV